MASDRLNNVSIWLDVCIYPYSRVRLSLVLMILIVIDFKIVVHCILLSSVGDICLNNANIEMIFALRE